MCTVGNGSLGINATEVGGSAAIDGSCTQSIVVNQFAFVLGQGLSGLLVNIAVDGIAQLVGHADMTAFYAGGVAGQ